MLIDLLKEGNYYLIDVREPLELEIDGAVEGATNIPLGEIEDHVGEVQDMAGNKIVFCRSGNRSGKALEYLQSQGVVNIYNGGSWVSVNEALASL